MSQAVTQSDICSWYIIIKVLVEHGLKGIRSFGNLFKGFKVCGSWIKLTILWNHYHVFRLYTICILQNTGMQRSGQIIRGKTAMLNNKTPRNIPNFDLKARLETRAGCPFVSLLFPAHRSRTKAI